MQALKHAGRFLLGLLLVLAGLAGLVLPIVPGWALLIPGLLLLADYIPAVHRLVEWGKRKFEEQAGPHLRKYRETSKQSEPGPPPDRGE